jgi:small subunit ribosomal protein S4e
MHKTRDSSSKVWPIPRKGTKYIVVPSRNHQNGIPLIILMRNILGLVDTKKEMKRLLHEKAVSVNGRIVHSEKHALLLFDTVELKNANKYYRLVYSENRKFGLEEIGEKETGKKICKLANKKVLSGKKIQLNFNDGINVLANEKINVGDSALINLSANKIEKVLPVREKAKVLLIKGKHLGSLGEIAKIEDKKIFVKSKDIMFETKNEEIIILE